uniref:PNPLA domain-containing protein n=1 Tax=Parastrongyloides trichosuri TaxID=131310 RepID=A0A0N4Z0X8_PARTI
MWGVKKYFNKPRSRSTDNCESSEFSLINAVKACDIRRIVHIYSMEKCEQKMWNASNDNLLHMAVSTENSLMVKTILLLYEKKCKFREKRNKQGLRPIDLANKEIEEVFKQWDGETNIMCESQCNGTSNYKESDMRKKLNSSILLQRLPHLSNKSKVLLSLDGGGIRGLAAIQILMKLEERLGMPIHDVVDWMAGTSTGAYISIMIAQKRSLEDMRKIYLKFKGKVFRGMRPYNTLVLEKSLQEILGTELFTHFEKPKIIVTTCKIYNNQPQLKLLRNYKTEKIKEDNSKKEDVDFDLMQTWEVGRCSSAAPTYFEPYKGFIDGGIMSNNPAMELLTEFFEHNYSRQIQKNLSKHENNGLDKIEQTQDSLNEKTAKITKDLWPTSICLNEECSNENKSSDNCMEDIACVISIGTGGWKGNIKVPEANAYSHNVNNNTHHNEPQRKNLIKKWVDLKGILPVFIRQLTASDGLPVERARAWCHSIGVPYFRITANHTDKLKLDDSNDISIIQMMWDTEIYLRTEGKSEINKLIHYLKLFCKIKQNSNSL